MKPKQIAIIAAIVFLGIISLQNMDSIRVDFLFWDFGISLILLFYILLALGFAAGFFTSAMMSGKKRETIQHGRKSEDT